MANELTVTIGDKKYPFRRINLTTFKKHIEFMKSGARLAQGETPDPAAMFDSLLEMAQIIHECVVRVRPEVTLDELMEGLDQGNIADVYAGVMSGSGFTPQAAPAGE